MSYPIAGGSVLEVTIETQVASQTCLTLLHYRLGTIGVPDGLAAIDAFDAVFNGDGFDSVVNRYADCLAQNVTIVALRYQWIYPLRYTRVTKSPGTTSGAVSSDASPPATAAALTKRAQLAGRKNRGTVHMPGVPLSFLNGGIVTGPGLAAYNSLCIVLSNPISVSGGAPTTPIILNRTTPTTSQDVVSCSPESTLRTMRRRVVGRGI